MKPYVFGVDIGGTTVKMGLFQTDGELVDVWEIPTRTEENGRYILADIAASAEKKLKEKNLSKDEVEGMGVGVPGPVGSDGTVYRCVNLGWDILNVNETLGSLTGLRTRAGNDANVAALGEMWKGGGTGSKNVVLMTLGTGVGGGIVVDGKIVAGADGAAGEIGHLPMEEEEELCCGCGKKGCLEQYASANGIVLLARRYLEDPAHESSLRTLEKITSKEIFDEAKKGDRGALAIVEKTSRYLGKAAAMIACVANPEVFVLGGGMANAGKILFDTVENCYRQYAFHAAKDTPFRAAVLGNHAGIYGSAYLILESAGE